ncbi:MAG TPA: phosphotransferase, partial [Anaerolineae bacterium]|nr:phosphotransferase [Anaerolineae bacterium]
MSTSMSLLNHAPHLTANQAGFFVRELYGLQAVATPMPSERDQNFLMMTQLSEKFVFKVANALEDKSLLEAQNLAMAQVNASQPVCPQVIHTQQGELIAEIQSPAGTKHFVRLLTYLAGVPLGEIRRQSDDLLRSLGQRVGLVDRALTKFDHPALHRDFHWDLANASKLVRQYEALIDDAELRLLVTKLTAIFEQSVAPLLPTLRTSIIHNDGNNFNVIVRGGDDLDTRNQQVVGLIDFGDMLHSYTVGGLAVAIAYAVLDRPDPLRAAEQVLRGYQLEYPLLE